MRSETGPDAEIGERVTRVRERIERAARRAGRDPREIRLVGVSKLQPPERVAAAVRAGITELGESYVQEARMKIPRVEALLDETQARRLRWHLVGRLQRNKAREAVRRFAVVHSLDRPELADELSRRAGIERRRLGVFLQVNLSGEAHKGGVAEVGLADLLDRVCALPALDLQGLMTVPAEAEAPEAARPVFARLRALRDALRERRPDADLGELSMGMSHDFEIAIEEGATVVRVGTDLFGPREARA